MRLDHPEKVVVFTGSGISAPSGIPTFRGAGGLWRQYRFEEVASPQAWSARPELVLEFYNERRAHAAAAEPNAAHRALAKLEQKFRVVVVTQNVDDLHERGGSSEVIHLHGELRKARSTADPSVVIELGGAPIRLGDCCPAGGQWRPHIVWFGENVMRLDEALEHIQTADRLLVVGTSLAVHPAAGLLQYVRDDARKAVVDVEIPYQVFGFEARQGSADEMVPRLMEEWLKN